MKTRALAIGAILLVAGMSVLACTGGDSPTTSTTTSTTVSATSTASPSTTNQPAETSSTTPTSTSTGTPTATATPSPTATATGDYTHQLPGAGELGTNVVTNPPPGQSTVLPREYPGAPPLVPHNLNGLVITADSNPCLMCHATGLSLGEDHVATKIPASHYTDKTTGEISENLQPLRYNCLLCHIPQTTE